MAQHPNPMYCVVCSASVPAGRRVTCGPICAAVQRNRQVSEHARKRKAHAKAREVGTCKICGGEFTRRSNSQIYCSNLECKDAGLALAVERQANRRKEARGDGDQ